MEDKADFLNFNFWRYLINSWTILFFIAIVYNFLNRSFSLDLLNLIAMIYIGVLTIYVSNKEFERWYYNHHRKHPGEIFVIIWTVLIISLVALKYLVKTSYHLPIAVVSSYIAVLTVLAITKKSKEAYQAHQSSGHKN